jgi:hypothetical protein
MSHHSRDPSGAHDFSSPQIRVRGANDFRQYSNQRLRLPNERPPLGPRIRQLIGALVTIAILGGVGVGVYFGVTLLLEDDEPSTAEVAEPVEATEAQSEAQAASEQAAESTQDAAPEQEPSEATGSAASVEQSQEQTSAQEQAQQPEPTQSTQQAAQPQAVVSVSSIEPSVTDELVTPAQIDGAEIVAERATAEPVPPGIPRSLADGAAYDPTEPATVFTARWPVGTTLRLTRLPGATLLTDEEQAEVVGTETLVVVRGSESSNTDLQLSPAAFEQIAFLGTERIIAVRVEVTAPPP